MKLQEKTSLILVFILIFLLALISLFVSVVSLTSYSELEHTYILKDIDRAVNQLQGEYDSLSSIIADWAPWDDTYAFVSGDNPGYVAKNIHPETYRTLRLDLIVIANARGEIVYSGEYDAGNHTIVSPPESLDHSLTLSSPLMNMHHPEETVTGILMAGNKSVIVASRPVVRSDFSGTPRGVIIMGRYVDEDEVSIMAKAAGENLVLVPLDDPSLSPAVRAEFTGNPSSSRTILPLENETIGGYALVKDLDGRDALVIGSLQHRDIYQQGIISTLQYILIVLASGLLFGVVILVILDRLVLSRVTALSRQVQEIGRRSTSSGRVSVEGSDEFSELSREINRMLDTIDRTHDGLMQSEARFRELTDLLPQTIFEIDNGGDIQYINKAGFDIFGMDEQMIRDGLNIRTYLIPGDVGRVQRGLVRIAGGAKPSGEIFHLRKKDGSIMSAIVYTAPVVRNGTFTGFRGSLIDITDRVRLEEALIESQEYLQTLLMSLSVGILVIDAETHTIIDTNPAALEMIGETRDKVVGRSCHDVVCPAEAGRCPVTDLGITVDNSQRILMTSDGRKISIIKHVVPVMLQGRSCLLETFIDNTARLQMQEELQQSRERLSHILRTSPVGVFESRANGTLSYVNERWEEMIGMTFETLRTRQWGEIHDPLDRTRISKEMWKKFQARLLPDAEARFMRPDGTVIWIYGQSVPVYDPDGQVRGYVGTITDITDRKRIEESVHLANKKLNLMNDITRHDILNTITGIFGLIDMAVASGDKEELAHLLDQIKEEGRLIQRQITFTRDYQGVGVNAPLWQNVRDVVSRAISGISNNGVSISIELEETEIFADPLLEKVFYNLLDNAMRYGERLKNIRFYYQISDIGLTLICEDDGVGIPETAKAKIFERGVGRNTGMGLFLTREILRITGISIRETGVYGKGARFEIIIPNGTWRFVKKQEKE